MTTATMIMMRLLPSPSSSSDVWGASEYDNYLEEPVLLNLLFLSFSGYPGLSTTF
jgi:hypothetical protein